MAGRYTPEELKLLRESPLVVKPPGLPPAELWMGPASDPTRNATRPNTGDRTKSNDPSLPLDQTNRRPVERHISRNSANPDDIILGPPKTSFLSATSARNTSKTFDSSDRPVLRDADSRDRYNFRGKAGDVEIERNRDGRNNGGLRPKRADGEDSDGWSTVKPRKSFGTEGAERFSGRMGGDRHREDRRFKDREEREVKEKPRGFDSYTREKDVEHDQERDNRRNGTGRGRNEPSWFKDREAAEAPPTPRDRNSNGDRFGGDRSRGWREKERDDNRGERPERNERGDRGDRRWDRDRDQRQEREPEWMEEPSEERTHAHTQEEFQKWKEQQKRKEQGRDAIQTPQEEAKHDEPSFFGLEKPKVETPLELSNGPDKFFGMWSTPREEITPDTGVDQKEGLPKAKPVGKASRFTSFFTPQDEPQRRQTEPPPSIPPPMTGGLMSLFTNSSKVNDARNDTQSPADKAAFAQLLQKLQMQTPGGSGSTPPANASMQPKPPAPEKQRSDPMPAPQPFQQYRQEEPRPSTRNSQQSMQDLLVQRQMAGSQPAVRPEQMLQDLVGQRHHNMSQPSGRPGQPSTQSTNTEFLMGLMQSARAAPEPQRTEQMLLRIQQPRGVDRQMQQQAIERDQELQREAAQREAVQRERTASQQRQFFDDTAAFQRGPPPQHQRQTGNAPQPTQILQRPPPAGLDMMGQLLPQHRIAQNIAPPPGLMPMNQLLPQHRMPPPGLSNGPSRGMPMPQNIYPSGFMGGFPPPEVMQQQPPAFFNAPPPGFGFQGPDGMSFGAPFDGRGPPPPQGAFRR